MPATIDEFTKQWYFSLVCPLFTTVMTCSLLGPLIFNSGNFLLLASRSFMLMGDWCFPEHVGKWSPHVDGPVGTREQTVFASYHVVSCRASRCRGTTEIRPGSSTWTHHHRRRSRSVGRGRILKRENRLRESP